MWLKYNILILPLPYPIFLLFYSVLSWFDVNYLHAYFTFFAGTINTSTNNIKCNLQVLTFYTWYHTIHILLKHHFWNLFGNICSSSWVVLKLQHPSESPGGLVKPHCTSSYSKSFQFNKSGFGPRNWHFWPISGITWWETLLYLLQFS